MIVNQDRMDAVHKAQYVGKKDAFSVQNLDAFALERNEPTQFGAMINVRHQIASAGLAKGVLGWFLNKNH